MIATTERTEQEHRAILAANGIDPRLDAATQDVRRYVETYRHWLEVCRQDRIAFRTAKCKLGWILNAWREGLRANRDFGVLLARFELSRHTARHAMVVAERLCDDQGNLSWEKCLAYGLNKAECLLRTTIGDVAELSFTQCAILCGAKHAQEKRSAEREGQAERRKTTGAENAAAVVARGQQRREEHGGLEDECGGDDRVERDVELETRCESCGESRGVVDRGHQPDAAGDSRRVSVDGVENGDGAQLMLWSEAVAARAKRAIDRLGQAVRLDMVNAEEAGVLTGRLEGIERDALAILHLADEAL